MKINEQKKSNNKKRVILKIYRLKIESKQIIFLS
jgi:hypothetical protein